mmetsp:Transcript_28845/g.43560  ORF Transcript_28845/g.43560 Transcript_28845/m.43560 type:complete len:105 (+) Transcript_28845:149-463(+)|eukprot:CAMPEP_0170511136 /NCGR_PEP_ID=MMETSP0208-20121228/66136_1 /TAXON_ID=197538 /ORGANISM="Strombidium inclinatum, Strain S3" /LENGTH=104 /DNA_ID=CAMNT_0010794643 /DNA_START=1571 /DNA_END=1885 /DNA_ORIENTATION=+
MRSRGGQTTAAVQHGVDIDDLARSPGHNLPTHSPMTKDMMSPQGLKGVDAGFSGKMIQIQPRQASAEGNQAMKEEPPSKVETGEDGVEDVDDEIDRINRSTFDD